MLQYIKPLKIPQCVIYMAYVVVNKIMYVEYITGDSKLLNGSVHFGIHLSETLLPMLHVLGVMLSS